MTDVADLAFRVDDRGLLRGTKALDDLAVKAGKAESATERMIAKAERLGESMSSLGSSLSMRVSAPLVAMAGVAVNSFARFDSAMNQSLAIMGDVSEELRGEMSQAARDMAKQTTFSAEQAAESYFFLSSAGLDARQSIEALPQVAKFAQAGMFDMATATDLATDAQSALGMSVEDPIRNLENLTKVTDTLVGANTLANASVEQFASSLTNRAGAAMKQLNIELEEGVGVLAAWADQGIKGLRAGEQFNIVTRELERAARDNADAWERLNLSVFDSEGNFRSMADIIGDLEGALEGMSTEQQGATLEMLGFQSESIAAIRPLIGLSDQIREYTRELKDMGGITDEVANNQLQSFSAQMGLTLSRINDVAISVGEALVPALSTLNKWLNDDIIPLAENWTDRFSEAEGSTQLLVIGVGALAAAIGPALVVMGALVKSVATLIPLMRSLNAATLANPFFMVATAVGAAAVAIERQFVPGMKEVGAMEQIINVLTRAWIVLSETIKAGAELTMAMAQTMVGAVRTVIAPIEGMVNSAGAAMQKLIERDFAGARDAIMGIGDEIVEASQRGQRQMQEGLEGMTEWWSELPERANEVVRSVTETRDALLDSADAADDANDGMKMLSGGVDMAIAAFEQYGGVAVEVNEQIENTKTGTDAASESVQEFEEKLRDQIDSLRRQKLELKGGTREVLMYELAQLKAEGATDQQVQTLEVLIDRIVESEKEIEALTDATHSQTDSMEGLDFGMTAVIQRLQELQQEYGKTSEATTEWERITTRGLDNLRNAFAGFISGEIESFSEFGDILTRTMESTVGDMVDVVLNSGLQGLFNGDGFQGFGIGAGPLMQDGQFTQAGSNLLGAGAGISSLLGNLIGGEVGGALSGLGQGALMGSSFGLPGAIIGGIVGGLAGLFGADRPPRYDLAGQATFDTAPGFRATNPESFQTELGTVYANFRRMDAQQEEQIREALRQFDATVADVVGDEFLHLAERAVESFAFESRFEGDDPSIFLEKRFDMILGHFSSFTRGLVRQEQGLEDQMQMLSDILDIRALVDADEQLGDLPFQRLVTGLVEMQEAGETLGETYQRVTAAFESYAKTAANLKIESMTAGLNDFQSEMVNIQLESLRMQESLHNAAEAAGLQSARTEDLARVHEMTANRMAAVIGRMEEAGRGLVEQLFGTELTRLQEQIQDARAGGASDEDIAGLLERQEELRAEEEQRRRQQQARELAQIIADTAQASGDAFSVVAERLGTTLDEVAGVLGMDGGAFEQMLEDMQVDPMAIASEIQGMADQIVHELVRLPGAFAAALRDAEEPPTEAPVENSDQPGSDPRTGPDYPTPQPGPEAITEPITESTGETTAAVRDLEGALTDVAGSQAETSQMVAAALNNLAQAIRQQGEAGRSRSSRTRTEVN
jgi:TP901 family phage tail tape measure protein